MNIARPTKEQLLTQLHNCKALYVTGLASLCLMGHPSAPDLLDDEKNTYVMINDYRQTFHGQVKHLREDKEFLLQSLHNLYLRALICESYELISEYCDKTKQYELLKSEKWYLPLRLVRNCITHSFRWNFDRLSKKEKKEIKFPITYRSLCISRDFQDQPLSFDKFNWVHIWNIHIDIMRFVEEKLC